MNIQLDFREAAASLPAMFLPTRDEAASRARGKRLLLLLLVVALAGLAAAATAFVRGHHVMGTTSEMPWGVLIATYVFFVVSSTGLCLVSSLGHVFGFKVFEPIAKKAILLALITLLVGFSVIASELERPILLAKMAILSPNPSSPIWWMGTLYGVYMVLIGTELVFLLREDHGKARIAGLVSVIAAISAHSNLGAVFGLSHARPFWYGPLLPIYFIASALVCGAALMILFTWLGDRFSESRDMREEHVPLFEALRRLLALFLGIVLFFTVWKIITGLAGHHDHKYEVTMASLTGPLFVSFLLFEVFLGIVLPLWILLSSKGRAPGGVALAAGMAMLAVFVMRVNFVYAGQMLSLKPTVGRLGEHYRYTPAFKGSSEGFLHYTPSIVEVLIVAGAISAAILLFVYGIRVLHLGAEGARAAEPAREA